MFSTRHPNLYIRPDELAGLKARAAKDDSFAARCRALYASKDALLKESFLTEAYANTAQTQHGNYYEIGSQLERFCDGLLPAVLLEGDKACLQKLTDALLHYASFQAWTGPANARRDVPWHSDLSTTRIAVAYARIYDVLYDELTETQRDTIADAALSLGIYPLLADWVSPGTRIHAMDSMGHNWWAVCIGLAGLSLLPFADRLPESECRTIFDQIHEALREFLDYPGQPLFNKSRNFDGEGLFYESTGYFNYGAGELLRYLYHAERYFGRIDILRTGVLPKLGDAILSFCYPTSEGIRFLNFGDSAYTADIRKIVLYLRLCGYGSPALAAYAQAAKGRNSVLELVHEDPSEPSGSFDALSEVRVFPESGYYIDRNSFEPDSTLFALKSGFTWNHAHEDAGSFVLYDRGEPVFTDSGSCSYGSPAYMDYFCRTRAHNAWLIGEKGQWEGDLYRGSRFPGRIDETFRNKGLHYVRADATGPYSHTCQRLFRNVFILSHKYFFILDDILTIRPEPVAFLLHQKGDAIIRQDALSVRNSTGSARVHTLYPSRSVWSEETGYPEQSGYSVAAPFKNGDSVYYREDYPETGDRCDKALLHVIALNQDGYDLAPLSSRDAIGVRLTESDRSVHELWFNLRADGRRMHINSNNVLGGFDTDAYLLFVSRKPGKHAAVTAVCSSYVRRKGRVYSSAFTKQTVSFTL